MKISLEIDDSLLDEAENVTGIGERALLVQRGLEALIARQIDPASEASNPALAEALRAAYAQNPGGNDLAFRNRANQDTADRNPW